MKKSNLYHVLGLMILFAVILSCNSDEPEDILPDEPFVEIIDWEKLDNFQERIYNIKIIDNKLYGTGIASYFYSKDIDGAINPMYFWGFVARTGRYKFPVSDKVLVSRSETDLFLFPADNVISEAVTRIKLDEIDPDFRFFEDMPRWTSDIFGLTNNGIGLVPFRKVINGFAKNNPTFFLFNTVKDGNNIRLGEYLIIDDDLESGFAECQRIESFDEFFLAHVNNSTYKIDVNGAISKFSNFRAKSVEIDNKIYSFIHNNGNNNIEVLVSDFSGNNTTPIAKTEYKDIFVRGEYFEINGEIILVFKNNIYWIKIVNNDIQLTELENQNLDFGDIYNVSMTQNEKVLISNICNTPNCGIFSKELEDFFKPKSE